MTLTTLVVSWLQLEGAVTGLREISCAVLALFITTRMKGTINSRNSRKAKITFTQFSTLRRMDTGREEVAAVVACITSPPPCAC